MSYTPKQPPHNVSYDALPSTHDDHIGDTLYDAPPSPGGHPQTFHTPEFDPRDLAPDESGIPPVGPAQPRFLGAALYDHGGDTHIRDSYASSHNTFPSIGGGGGSSEYGHSSVYALNDPLAGQNLSQSLFDGHYRDDPPDGYFHGEPGSLAMAPVGQSRYLEEKRATYAAPRTKSKLKIMILAVLVSLILLIAAVLIPLYFAVIKPKSHKDVVDTSGGSSSAKPSSTGKAGSPSVAVVTGGDGSKVTMDDGSTFTYSNKLGGYWYWDPNDPFNNGAKAQSWSPALNETFNYGIDRIRG
jgi:glucan 1,3-beta-glucosidase